MCLRTLLNIPVVVSAGDCWEIGRQAYLIGEDETAMSWMEESLRRYHQEAEKTVPIADIIKYYAFSSFENGLYLFIKNQTFTARRVFNFP